MSSKSKGPATDQYLDIKAIPGAANGGVSPRGGKGSTYEEIPGARPPQSQNYAAFPIDKQTQTEHSTANNTAPRPVQQQQGNYGSFMPTNAPGIQQQPAPAQQPQAQTPKQTQVGGGNSNYASFMPSVSVQQQPSQGNSNPHAIVMDPKGGFAQQMLAEQTRGGSASASTSSPNFQQTQNGNYGDFSQMGFMTAPSGQAPPTAEPHRTTSSNSVAPQGNYGSFAPITQTAPGGLERRGAAEQHQAIPVTTAAPKNDSNYQSFMPLSGGNQPAGGGKFTEVQPASSSPSIQRPTRVESPGLDTASRNGTGFSGASLATSEEKGKKRDKSSSSSKDKDKRDKSSSSSSKDKEKSKSRDKDKEKSKSKDKDKEKSKSKSKSK